MSDETENIGNDTLLIGQSRSILDRITLDGEEFTKEDVEKAIKKVAQLLNADFGRERKTLKNRITELEAENEGFQKSFTEVETTKRELAAEVEASKVGTFNVKAQLEQTFSRALKNKAFFVKTFQAGGVSQGAILTQEDLLERASGFAETVAGDGAVSHTHHRQQTESAVSQQ